MDKQEILRYISLGKHCAISVDKRLLDEYPGIAREVWINRDNRVQILFVDKYVEETDEAAVDFYFDYDNETNLIQALEKFIQKPLVGWVNYTNVGLKFPLGNSLETSWMQLKIDYVDKKLEFPTGWQIFVTDRYWKALFDGELMINASTDEIRRWVLNQVEH